MSHKDYKTTPRVPKQRESMPESKSIWPMVLLGVTIGVGIAAALVYVLNRSDSPFDYVQNFNKEDRAAELSSPPIELSPGLVDSGQDPAKPWVPKSPEEMATIAQSPEETPEDKQFAYYQILQNNDGSELSSPDGVPSSPNPASVDPNVGQVDPIPSTPQAPLRQPSKTNAQQQTLQLGAFKEEQDAETLKGRLAFLGVEARIVPNEQGLYRVRVGPFSKAEELKQVQQRLEREGIPVVVLP